MMHSAHAQRLRRSAPLVFALALVLAASGVANGAIITVSTAADTVSPDGFCSLREAIMSANGDVPTNECPAGSGADVIEFADALPCPTTITLTSLLPPVTAALEINGYSHSGSTANTSTTATNAALCIVLDAGGFSEGLNIVAGGSRVRGLVLQNHTTQAIIVNAGSGTTIDGNFVGTNVAGTATSGFTQGHGITVVAAGTTVGGTTPAARNLISGNGGYGILFFAADDGFIQGNLVGTNAAGTAAVPNGAAGTAGIQLGNGSTGNLVGGATAAARNVISGNTADGVQVLGPNNGTNTVQGNFIGVTADGSAALPNGRHGVVLYEFAAGGASAGNIIDGNLIAGHPRKAIAVDGPVFTDTVVTNNVIGALADGVTPAANGTGAEPAGVTAPDPAIDILHGASARVAENRIFNHSGGAGVLVRNIEFSAGDPDIGPGTLLTASTGNCLVGNTDGAINDSSAGATFTGNWWGAADGPSGAGTGSGDSVSTDIVFSPFLFIAPTFTAHDGSSVECAGTLSVLEIPTVGAVGALLLALLLATASFLALRRTGLARRD